VAFSPNGRRLATTGGIAVRVWDSATSEEQLTLTSHIGSVRSVAFSPDGRRLAVAADGGIVQVWDSATGEQQLTLTSVQVWDSATGEQQLTLTSHIGSVRSVVFSPDGRRLATTDDDDIVRLWDSATGEQQLAPNGPVGSVRSVAFSPDWRRLATTDEGGTVRLWDSATGEQTDFQVNNLPEGELVVWLLPKLRPAGASEGAWRWLGWLTPIGDGTLIRFPAETYGPLPPLT
jgi:WD40 repeat protein